MAAPMVELLLVPDCPYADAARTLLFTCLDELGLDAAVVEMVGEHPSPTIVVNGLDVMTGATPGTGPAACRLDIPTAPRVRRALEHASAPTPAGRPDTSDAYPAELAVGVSRDRITVMSPAGRALHQAILRAFAATGTSPGRAELTAATPPGNDLESLLAELHEQDVVRLDDSGEIQAAYPFSGVPTGHKVAVNRGPVVYARCAIDALGMAAMLGRDITITSTDPQAGTPIVVQLHHGRAVWRPGTAVVFVGADDITAPPGHGCCPPAEAERPRTVAAADRCCRLMDFFVDTDTAQQWLRAHPDVSGVILNQEQALRLGTDIFGQLLHHRPDHPERELPRPVGQSAG